MKNLLSAIITAVLLCGTLLPTVLFAAADEDPFILIPKSKSDYKVDVKKLTTPETGKKFRVEYNKTGAKYAEKDKGSTPGKIYICDLGAMLSSGIVTRDTILCLVVRLVKFIANMALIVGSLMIIYAGYLYVTTALSGSSADSTSKANEAVKDAMIGVTIVVFSYAIQRIVTQAFLS